MRGLAPSRSALWVVVACVALVGHAVMPDGAWRDGVMVAIGAAAVVAVVLARRRMAPVDRRGWLLLACGLGAWVLGDLTWAVLARGLHAEPSTSVADVAYLASYPLLGVGLVRAFPVSGGRRGRWLLDAFLLVGGIVLLVWIVVLDPELAAVRAGSPGSLVEPLYPLGDVALLMVLVRPFLATTTQVHTHRRAHRLATAAVLVILLTDVLYQFGSTHEGWAARLYLLDSGWLVGYLLLAAAARQMLRPERATESVSAELSRLHVGLIAVSAGIIPMTLVVTGLRHAHVPLLEVCTIGILMQICVLSRFGGVVRDLRDRNARLARVAVTDPLTGLANAAATATRVEGTAVADEPGSVPALVLVSVDGYRAVVDTLGHDAADDLLRAFADALRTVAPAGALAARLSRHVFAVAMDVPGPAEAAALTRALIDRLPRSHRVNGMALDTGAVAGLAVARSRPAAFSEVAGRADVAMDAARRTQELLAVDGEDTDGRTIRGGDLMPELAHAASAGELVVHYQAVARVTDGSLFAAEALVRWQHPVHGWLTPDAFVPAAERIGLVHLITAYVLEDALDVCARLRTRVPDFTVAVNVSAHDLDAPDLVDRVQAALQRHDLPASALSLEVTETMAMRDVPRAERTMRALAALGVHLAVDDYGVGYGSLDYLRRLPFTVLKVDRAFVGPAVDDPVCAEILVSTVALGHALGMHVVAEGAEDVPTLDLLRVLGYDSVQGWAVGRPVAAAELERAFDAAAAGVPVVHQVPTPRR